MTALTGWLVALCAAIAIVSGLAPAWYYVAEASGAHASVIELESMTLLGPSIRSLHHFSSQACVVLVSAHLVSLFVLKRERIEDSWRWVSGVLALVLLLAAAFSGRSLPWDQHGAVSWNVGVSLLVPGSRPGVSGSAPLARILALHVAASVGLAALSWEHVQRRDGVRRLLELPRGLKRAGIGLVALLVIGSMAIRAPLGPTFEQAATAGAVSSEWYVRWVEVLATRSGWLARLGVVAVCALALATPWWGRRLGIARVRGVWWAVLSMMTLLSLLPIR